MGWVQNILGGVQADLRIWKNKVHRGRPVLCKADVHLAQFRQWAKQFYTNLLETSSLEQAFLQARKDLHARNADHPIWASPMLVIQSKREGT